MIQNALTIDLEDWYQGLTSTSQRVELWNTYEQRIVANTERLLELLAQSGIKATFFVLGYVADHLPDLVRKVAAEGHEIALHSYHHQRVSQLTSSQFRAEVQRGLEAVQWSSGRQVSGFRAPMFSINHSSLWALEELRDLGFRYDSSLFPIHNPYYGLPGTSRFPYHPFNGSSFVEFPLSTIRILGINFPVAGGFYGRLLPLSWIGAAIHKLNQQRQPAILYAHPWEFDTEQRFSQVTPRERITHYYGRSGLHEKFARLLQEFRFGPLSDLLDSVP